MKQALKVVLPILWLVTLITPPVLFLSTRPAESLSDPRVLFPVFGLIAFTLIWLQIMLGAFMRQLVRIFPKVLTLHIGQGIFALGFAVLHPFTLIYSFLPGNLEDYFHYTFIAPEMKFFVHLGQASVPLLILGIFAGAMRNWAPIKRVWRWLHMVHYVVFFAIFFHSWNLGTDLATSPYLRGLWIFFFVTVVIAIVYRRVYIPHKENSR